MTPIPDMSRQVRPADIDDDAGASVVAGDPSRRAARRPMTSWALGTMTAVALAQDRPNAWREARTCIETIANCIEEGLMVLDGSGRVSFCNESMAGILGIERAALEDMSSEGLLDLLGDLVRDPPPVVRARQLLDTRDRIICEEFEIPGPPRSVVRWVAHGVSDPEPAIVVVCTDITAEVDLATTYERDATIDRLTDIFNRRGIEPQIAREISRATRHGSPFSLLILDVDHFKKINDQHGHGVGDLVLRGAAQMIAKTVRATDLVGRWGGEEFLVLLPHTDLQHARQAAERIRRAIEMTPLCEGHHVTVSGGIAEFGISDTGSGLVARADKQLYVAKSSGRNCIC
jgi:diguanylate cyclase (GGDEF)-like protein